MTYLTTTTTTPRIARAAKARPAPSHEGPLARAQRYWRAWRNRRAIAELMALDAYELSDIGVTRGEVASALALPLSQDPSTHLAEGIAERRRVERLNRLCR